MIALKKIFATNESVVEMYSCTSLQMHIFVAGVSWNSMGLSGRMLANAIQLNYANGKTLKLDEFQPTPCYFVSN